MRPNPRFLRQPKDFWANVRSVSQRLGYTARGTRRILVPTMRDVVEALHALDLAAGHLLRANGTPNRFGRKLLDYYAYRAEVLERFVEPRLMDGRQAKALFQRLRKELNPTCPLPMNKQKGKKKAHAFLTCIINMLVEANAKGCPCNYDPGELTTVTRDNAPLRTLARRVDGAFPRAINPIAVWEIKEYYYTTTFGSRVADGVYETLVDGMELEELREHEGVRIRHYLIVDAHYTWWECGKSYLCRIVDMLHMGYVDEVLFGREVIEELPRIVGEWVAELR
jgi:hypothetical protein